MRKLKFIDIFCEPNGQLSSKRVITVAACVALFITWGANLWYGLKPEEFIYDGILTLALGGFGFSAMEKFSKHNSNLEIADSETKEESKNDKEPIISEENKI